MNMFVFFQSSNKQIQANSATHVFFKMTLKGAKCHWFLSKTHISLRRNFETNKKTNHFSGQGISASEVNEYYGFLAGAYRDEQS